MTYQNRVFSWINRCFGARIAMDITERNLRFLEEALELVQATGLSKYEVLELVEYVYHRPVGAPQQGVGGTMVCLAALCSAVGIDLDVAAELELTRCHANTHKIQEKHANKPAHVKGPSSQ